MNMNEIKQDEQQLCECKNQCIITMPIKIFKKNDNKVVSHLFLTK